MDNRDLVRMANQITSYFSIYPKGEALDGIGKHIHMSWEPRMRDQLKALLDDGGDGLDPLFIEAMADYFKGPKSPAAKISVKGKLVNNGAAPDPARGT